MNKLIVIIALDLKSGFVYICILFNNLTFSFKHRIWQKIPLIHPNYTWDTYSIYSNDKCIMHSDVKLLWCSAPLTYSLGHCQKNTKLWSSIHTHLWGQSSVTLVIFSIEMHFCPYVLQDWNLTKSFQLISLKWGAELLWLHCIGCVYYCR